MTTPALQPTAAPELPSFDSTDLASLRAAFSSAPEWSISQAWLPEPLPEFLPASVRFGWKDNALCVLANLQDREIVTKAQNHNDHMWSLGDVFELFLRDTAGEQYYELHIAPNNLHLQLRFPDAQALRSGQPLKTFMIDEPIFEHHIFRPEGFEGWTVFARVPQSVFSPDSISGRTWLASFSRYDYVADDSIKPILSSTSAHEELNYHRQQEWRPILFS